MARLHFGNVCRENVFEFGGMIGGKKITVEKVPLRVTAREDGWNGLRIAGTLDFSLIGVLSDLATVLARNGISIFAVSTFDTDYIFVKSDCFEDASRVLVAAGYTFD